MNAKQYTRLKNFGLQKREFRGAPAEEKEREEFHKNQMYE